MARQINTTSGGQTKKILDLGVGEGHTAKQILDRVTVDLCL